jgi:hypothetical protein
MAILFNSIIIEYVFSILRYLNYVVGDLIIAMAKVV